MILINATNGSQHVFNDDERAVFLIWIVWHLSPGLTYSVITVDSATITNIEVHNLTTDDRIAQSVHNSPAESDAGMSTLTS